MLAMLLYERWRRVAWFGNPRARAIGVERVRFKSSKKPRKGQASSDSGGLCMSDPGIYDIHISSLMVLMHFRKLSAERGK